MSTTVNVHVHGVTEDADAPESKAAFAAGFKHALERVAEILAADEKAGNPPPTLEQLRKLLPNVKPRA